MSSDPSNDLRRLQLREHVDDDDQKPSEAASAVSETLSDPQMYRSDPFAVNLVPPAAANAAADDDVKREYEPPSIVDPASGAEMRVSDRSGPPVTSQITLDHSILPTQAPEDVPKTLPSTTPLPSSPSTSPPRPRSASVAILLQPRSYLHRWIRYPSHTHSPSSSSQTLPGAPYDTYNPAETSPEHLFERPERLRAINVGVAALVARLEAKEGGDDEDEDEDEDEALLQAEEAWLKARRELDEDDTAAGVGVGVAAVRTTTKRERRQVAQQRLTAARGGYEQARFAADRDRQRRGKPPPRRLETNTKNDGQGVMLGRHVFLSPIPPRTPVPPPPPPTAAPAAALATGESSRSSRSTRLRAQPSATSSSSSAAASGDRLLVNAAVSYAHADPSELRAPFASSTYPPPRPDYLRSLIRWCLDAPAAIQRGGCEIPADRTDMNANDLYLGPGSIEAIEGCVETVTQAVDLVHTSSVGAAFCAIRPPGHHCGRDTPSGFCYVNNVVVGAMHAYLAHDIDRAVILDFDLHHGNGTQSIVMGLNEGAETSPPASDGGRRGWRGFYGSLHDVYSYPCESGDLDLIKDASVNVAAHGQYIANIHLETYTDERDFYARLYPRYIELLSRAAQFINETQATEEKTMVFISAGFDACEHEHQEMQRHQRRVPASFFARFTADVAAFAREHCKGRIVSVLEGGYSDEALTSGVMSHLSGFIEGAGRDSWWSEDAVKHYASCTAKRRTGDLLPLANDTSPFPWARHLHDTMQLLQDHEGLTYKPQKVVAPRTIKTRSTAATPDKTSDLESALAGMSLGGEAPKLAPKLVFTFKRE